MASNYIHFKHDDHYHYDLKGYGSLLPDLSYGPSPKQRIDLYIPHIRKDRYPLIIYIHGGPFNRGDKTHHISQMLNGLRYGIAVAAVNYRLNDEAPYPAFMDDVYQAIAYLKKQADHYHLNKDQFFLWGDTHGGWIATMAGVHPQPETNVAGVISLSAPLDLADFYDLNKNRHGLYSNGLHDEVTFLKKDQELIDFLKTLNPIQYIDESAPPFYLRHGLLDQKIPQSYTANFAEALAMHHNSFVLDFVKDGEHPIDFYDEERYAEPVFDFIKIIIRN